MRAIEAQIIAALIRWTPPQRREWQAFVWKRVDATTHAPTSSFVYVVYQWGDANWQRNQWQLDRWADVWGRDSVSEHIAGLWREQLYDWRGRLVAPFLPLARALRRRWLLLRGIHCEALDRVNGVDGVACREAGERALALTIDSGEQSEEVNLRLCAAHEAALWRRGGTMAFRDGTTFTTAALRSVSVAGYDTEGAV